MNCAYIWYWMRKSTIISHDVISCLKPPTAFEKLVANLGLRGCQKDYYHFSAAINGIFWYDPALYTAIYQVLRSPSFSMDDIYDIKLSFLSIHKKKWQNKATS